MKPFFSIVVVSYNAETVIRDTINSILEQSFSDYEIIVKDGLSKDKTLMMIPVSEKIIVYSEEDKGIYDAMNQAISYCNGQYVAFINCGDRFYDKDVLKNIYRYASLQKCSDGMVLYGDLFKCGYEMVQMPKVTLSKLYRTTLCHQTLFINKNIFQIYGLYDTTYKVSADYEHILRVYQNNIRFVHCDVIVVNYEGGGFSETNGDMLKLENVRIRQKYFSPTKIRIYEFLSFGLLRRILSFAFSKCKSELLKERYRKLANFLIKKRII